MVVPWCRLSITIRNNNIHRNFKYCDIKHYYYFTLLRCPNAYHKLTKNLLQNL